MKKFWCLFLVLMLLSVSAGVLVADEVSGDVDVDETEMTVEKVEITDYERQSVNSQLEVALMALSLPQEEEIEEEGAEEEKTMDEVAERHAFIAWAHYNHVPPSRKLQEYVEQMTFTVERIEQVTREVQVVEEVWDEETQTFIDVPRMTTITEDVTVTDEVSAWNWEDIKSAILAGDYSFVGNVPVPDGLKSTGNPDGTSWGQFKKTLQVETATTVKANNQNREKSNNGNKGENGNKGGNGKGEGKGHDK
ncbi:MAG: hypothetical protein JW971_07245 [Synergistales bacterium]|nr:hypothetical protein [Synergistales bacterium]